MQAPHRTLPLPPAGSVGLQAQLRLEVWLVAAAIVLTLSACLRVAPVLPEKVRLLEALAGASVPGRLAAAEHHALTGGARAPDDGRVHVPGRSGRVAFELQGPVVVAHGQLGRERGRAYALPFAPAWDEQALGWHLLWLCGAAPVPQGWTSPPRPPVQGLRQEELLHVCRG